MASAEVQAKTVTDPIAPGRKAAGRALIWGATILLGLVILVQALGAADQGPMHFDTWRPTLYAYVLWAIAIGAAQVMIRGEAGQRALFILPAALFTIAVVIFPTFFGLYIAFTEWNLSSFEGRRFNGIDNLVELFHTTPSIGRRSATWCSTSPWCSSNTRSPSGSPCC